jgi:Ca-activated chloride channel family protein
MSIERPLAFGVAIVLAIGTAGLLLHLDGRRRKAAFTYSNLAFLIDAAHVSRWPGRLAAGALGLGVLLACIAFAGVRLVLSVPARDGSVVLCLDTSGSMRSTDVEPSREAAVRAAARAFIRYAPDGTRIGIVSFATGAERISEPTADKQAVLEALGRVPPANGATAIGDALVLAGQMLPATGRRVIVLVTDGVNNRGADPLGVAQRLAARGIGIYTVGVGTNGSGIAIPGTTEEASIDEDALRALAAAGHGSYTRTLDAGAIAATFRNLARTTVWVRRRVDISLALAAAGAGTLLLTLLGASAAGRFP